MAVVLVVVACAGAAAALWGRRPEAVPGSPARSDVIQYLDQVRTVPRRETVPGYGRDCPGPCVFGRAWSDATSAPGGGNGCSTRQDVLARDIRGAQPVDGDRCARRGGELTDPYTGRVVRLGAYRDVHVDHVFPLAAAWDMGAAAWPQQLRERFANDVDLNLLAVTAEANTAKGDSLPAEWMPAAAWRCFYTYRLTLVAVAYGLAVTDDDRREMQRAARTCPRR